MICIYIVLNYCFYKKAIKYRLIFHIYLYKSCNVLHEQHKLDAIYKKHVKF